MEDDLRVRQQLFERLIGILRPDDVDQFDLLELVLSNHPAGVRPIGAGLGSKTRCVGRQAHGQLVGLHDALTHEVAQGHLGRGYQP